MLSVDDMHYTMSFGLLVLFFFEFLQFELGELGRDCGGSCLS